MWIEIFKAGELKDSAGKIQKISPERLAEMAESYNKKVADDPAAAAPLVKGHPKNNDPAYGWVEKLSRKGGKLLAKVKYISPELAAEVRKGMFRKVSVSLYPDMSLRHVGLLGAFPPAVKGLAPVEFSDAEETHDFSLERDDSAEGELLAENEELHEKNTRLLAELELERERAELAEISDFVRELEERTGMMRRQADMLRNLLIEVRRLDETGALQQSFRDFAECISPAIDFGEYTASRADKENAFEGRNVNPDRLEIHRRAKEEMNRIPGLGYEEAVCLVLKT